MNRPRLTEKSSAALAALALTAGLGLAGAPPASAAYCGIIWGSMAEGVDTLSAAPITNVRSGRHDCFDRLVIDVSGDAPGYHVAYVSSYDPYGSGSPIPLRGGAILSVTVNAPAHDSDYQPTYAPAHRTEIVDVTDYSTFRQVAMAGTYEGYTGFGIGVRARLPMRAFVVPGPGEGSRVVVDVAHFW